MYLPDKFSQHTLVTDELFSATLDKSIRAQAFWQKIPNNKTQKTNNNQIQNVNDQKLSADRAVYNGFVFLIIEIWYFVY